MDRFGSVSPAAVNCLLLVELVGGLSLPIVAIWWDGNLGLVILSPKGQPMNKCGLNSESIFWSRKETPNLRKQREAHVPAGQGPQRGAQLAPFMPGPSSGPGSHLHPNLTPQPSCRSFEPQIYFQKTSFCFCELIFQDPNCYIPRPYTYFSDSNENFI